jgi:thermostable 8-oxoguanine DNA glycosylase
MTSNWTFDSFVVGKVKAFFEEHRNSSFVQKRIRTNTIQRTSPVTKDEFWYWMVACLLTSRQPSGPKLPVANFIRTVPSPLTYGVCRDSSNLATFAESVLTDFGGLRFATRIGKFIAENMLFVDSGGWELIFQQLEIARENSTPTTERLAAELLAFHLSGIGPKQSRNVLQCLGLSKYEVPLDSRTSKWMVTFGFPEVTTKELQNRKSYNLISDNYQRLCEACGIMPCVLDAAIFSSFDDDG